MIFFVSYTLGSSLFSVAERTDGSGAHGRWKDFVEVLQADLGSLGRRIAHARLARLLLRGVAPPQQRRLRHGGRRAAKLQSEELRIHATSKILL